MFLAIDDTKKCEWADIVARNSFAGLQVLLSLTTPIDELYIDYDLGDNSKNGLYVLKHALENELLPNKIIIISMDLPGIKAIKEFLINNGYRLEENSNCRYEKINRFPVLGTPEDQDKEAARQDYVPDEKPIEDMTTKELIEMKNVKHPICPINMYFEGDEDKCDVSKCDFENRSCTEACTGFYRDKKGGRHIIDL